LTVNAHVCRPTLWAYRGQPHIALSEPAHTYNDDCPHCGDGRSGTRCDLAAYSVRRIRFVLAHREGFNAAYLNPDKRSSSSELERLNREYQTLPPRHSCTCRCPREDLARGYPPCAECRRLRAQVPLQDIGVSIGRTAMVHPPTPSPLMLDLERAIAVVGIDNPSAIARYMTLNGTSMAANLRPPAAPSQPLEETTPIPAACVTPEPKPKTEPTSLDATLRPHHRPRSRVFSADAADNADVGPDPVLRVAVARELICLMCSRTGVAGQPQCRWCGGSLVLVTVE
jgi:hypothetical protein